MGISAGFMYTLINREDPFHESTYYVTVATLRLPPDIELNDTAIMLAALSGWLTVGGNPLHSVGGAETLKRARRGVIAQDWNIRMIRCRQQQGACDDRSSNRFHGHSGRAAP
jgi:hypothetical protein